MIAVGILRWYQNYQREEIENFILSRGVSISTGEISNLSEEFLVRFYSLHKHHVNQMNACFEKNGGYRLHLDGTGEPGNEIVFMAKDGATGITLDAQTMTSENTQFITTFLQALKVSYGTPIVIVRDMSKQIRDAATEVFPDVMQQICHYHFVKNLGNILFKKRYAAFRKNIVNTRILSQLKQMNDGRFMGKSRDSDSILFVAERQWITLAIEHILNGREQVSNYPFILPYLGIMDNILVIHRWNKQILNWNLSHDIYCQEIVEFSEKLDVITGNTEIFNQFTAINKIWSWFEKVREILRVGRHLSQKGCEPTMCGNSQRIKQDLMAALSDIDDEGIVSGVELSKAAKQLTSNCRIHVDELFVEVKDRSGNVVEIVRDNNIEERGHRWSRMHIRRRTGRTKTTNEMAYHGALTAIFSNLENMTYVSEVFSDVNDFPREIQNITRDEIRESRLLIKPYVREKMIPSDSKRFEILESFVDLLEQGGSIESWVLNLGKSDPLMTP